MSTVQLMLLVGWATCRLMSLLNQCPSTACCPPRLVLRLATKWQCPSTACCPPHLVLRLVGGQNAIKAPTNSKQIARHVAHPTKWQCPSTACCPPRLVLRLAGGQHAIKAPINSKQIARHVAHPTLCLLLLVGQVVWAEERIPVKVQPLEKQTVYETVTAWGEVEQDPQQLYFEVGGYISTLDVDTGQIVEQGQVLARLDTVLLENQRQQAQVTLAHAQKKLARTQKLKRSKAVGQEQLDDAASDHALKALALARLEQELAKRVLRAPAGGKILNRLLDFPTAIAAGTPLFTFKTTTAPWLVKVMVADRHLPKLQLGDIAQVVVSAFPQQPLTGTLHQIAEGTTRAGNLFEIEVALTAVPAFVRAGMQAKAMFNTTVHSGYVIPLNVFYRISGSEGVLFMLKQAESTVHLVTAEFSYVRGTDAIVSTDLSEFAGVVVAGQQHLREGALVEVLTD